MKAFLQDIKDSIKYAFSDKAAIIIIGSLMAITSIVYKNESVPPVYKLITVTMLIIMGYGSYVSWYTLKGSDKHPKFKNLKRITWEGFKKSLINFIYGIGLTYFLHIAKTNIPNGNILIGALATIAFILLYLCLIGGLLNRYIHRGKFSEAFHISEILDLMSLFDVKSFIKVLLAVLISQTFALSVFVGFSDGFSMIELIYSISTFFLAPFLYIATKRLVGMNVRKLLEKNDIRRVDE